MDAYCADEFYYEDKVFEVSSLPDIKQYTLLQMIQLLKELKISKISTRLRIGSYSPVREHAESRLRELENFLINNGINKEYFFGVVNPPQTDKEKINNKKKTFWIKIIPIFSESK